MGGAKSPHASNCDGPLRQQEAVRYGRNALSRQMPPASTVYASLTALTW